MRTFACPTCGAEVPGGNPTPYAVCRFCKSLLVRTDLAMQSIGRVAEVPDDFSPLQIGVVGQYDGSQFHVVGRLRKLWDEGSWNEWCVLFDDQRFGWLAEAQGDLVMTFEQPPNSLKDAPAADQAARAAPGNTWSLGGRPFSVTDIKQVTCQAAEGELGDAFKPGESVLCIDLRGTGLEFATVEFRGSAIKAYLGRFIEFADCQFTNLRKLDGWDVER